MIRVDFDDPSGFCKKIERLARSNNIAEAAVKAVANKTYEVAVEWTPLDRWRNIYQYPELAPHEPGDMKKHWRKPSLTRYGNNYTATVVNDAEYAYAVNYGHRAIPGQYVPAIPGRIKTTFVTGLFITDAVENMMNTNHAHVFSDEYAKRLERYLNG